MIVLSIWVLFFIRRKGWHWNTEENNKKYKSCRWLEWNILSKDITKQRKKNMGNIIRSEILIMTERKKKKLLIIEFCTINVTFMNIITKKDERTGNGFHDWEYREYDTGSWAISACIGNIHVEWMMFNFQHRYWNSHGRLGIWQSREIKIEWQESSGNDWIERRKWKMGYTKCCQMLQIEEMIRRVTYLFWH